MGQNSVSRVSEIDSRYDWRDRARRVARGIRRRVLDHTVKNKGGYLSQACSSAEILATLYTRVMKLGPSVAPPVPAPFPGVPGVHNPGYFTGVGYNGEKASDLDRFFLSPVHYSLALYAALIETGRMAPDGLGQFNQDGSTVEMIGAEHSPGLEVTAGSLGQCLSQAAGIALARRRRGDSGRVWVMMSDGEFQEGQTWETFHALANYHLDNIGIFVDVNGQQCDGLMSDVMSVEPLKTKLDAFGLRVVLVDGQDVEALAAPADLAPNGMPLLVLAYTDPCAGLDILRARAPKLHYVRFKDEAERELYRSTLLEMERED